MASFELLPYVLYPKVVEPRMIGTFWFLIYDNPSCENIARCFALSWNIHVNSSTMDEAPYMLTLIPAHTRLIWGL